MSSIEYFLRYSSIFLLSARFVYWFITEVKANKHKPRSQQVTLWSLIKRSLITILAIPMLYQLLGWSFLSFQNTFINQLLGFIFIVSSVIISFVARKELGTNWIHAAEYQIKKEQELITTGIYAYIRHPIYLGVLLTAIGVELLVGSYLLLFFLITVPIAAYLQAKKEEQLLLKHFGKKYEQYMKKSYMFIPFVL